MQHLHAPRDSSSPALLGALQQLLMVVEPASLKEQWLPSDHVLGVDLGRVLYLSMCS